MAKITPPQSIPAEWLTQYRGNLTEKTPGNIVRKRYPYRLPKMQSNKGHPQTKQLIQRERFKTAIANFKNTSEDERQRWYDAMPIWGSFLWYYNYFILSDLTGNANINQGGAGVIKSIQVVTQSVPTTGGSTFEIETVDPAKTVVMLYGNSYIADKVHHYDGAMDDNSEVQVNLDPQIDPNIAEVIVYGAGGFMALYEAQGEGHWGNIVLSEVTASHVKVKLANLSSNQQFNYAIEIIEHKSQTIYPVIVSIAATEIVIDWAKEPSVAADISILVIEYI